MLHKILDFSHRVATKIRCFQVCEYVCIGGGWVSYTIERVLRLAQVGKQNETPNQRQDVNCILYCVNQRGADDLAVVLVVEMWFSCMESKHIRNHEEN